MRPRPFTTYNQSETHRVDATNACTHPSLHSVHYVIRRCNCQLAVSWLNFLDAIAFEAFETYDSSILLRSKYLKLERFLLHFRVNYWINKAEEEEEGWPVSRATGNWKTSFEINVKSTTRDESGKCSCEFELFLSDGNGGCRSEERRTRNKQLRLLWRVWRTNNIFEVKWIESINGARRIKKVDPRPQEFPFAFFLSYYYVKEFNSKK